MNLNPLSSHLACYAGQHVSLVWPCLHFAGFDFALISPPFRQASPIHFHIVCPKNSRPTLHKFLEKLPASGMLQSQSLVITGGEFHQVNQNLDTRRLDKGEWS